MGMQNSIKIYQKVQGIGPVSLFSEFEPRQNLDQSQISFDNRIGYILSISMCMQNFITVLEIAPFHFFRIWSSAKPRPIKQVSSQHFGLDLVNINVYAISWATSCQYTNVYAKFHHNIPLSSRAIFTFSEFGARQNLGRWKMTFQNLLG